MKIMASGPFAPWQISGKTMGTVTDFIFLGSKITADGDCSHEIKRCFLLGRKAMTNLDSILKSRDIILLTKVHLVKAMVFPVVMYGYKSWTVKKAEHQIIDAFDLWCWRRHLRVPWTATRSNLKEVNPEYSLAGLLLKLNLQYFGHLMRRTDSLEKTLMLRKIEGRRRRGRQRRWDGWMASPIWWTWVWVSSGSWWWTGKTGGAAVHGVTQIRTWLSDWTELKWITAELNLTELNYRNQQFWHSGFCGWKDPCSLLTWLSRRGPRVSLMKTVFHTRPWLESMEFCIQPASSLRSQLQRSVWKTLCKEEKSFGLWLREKQCAIYENFPFVQYLLFHPHMTESSWNKTKGLSMVYEGKWYLTLARTGLRHWVVLSHSHQVMEPDYGYDTALIKHVMTKSWPYE